MSCIRGRSGHQAGALRLHQWRIKLAGGGLTCTIAAQPIGVGCSLVFREPRHACPHPPCVRLPIFVLVFVGVTHLACLVFVGVNTEPGGQEGRKQLIHQGHWPTGLLHLFAVVVITVPLYQGPSLIRELIPGQRVSPEKSSASFDLRSRQCMRCRCSDSLTADGMCSLRSVGLGCLCTCCWLIKVAFLFQVFSTIFCPVPPEFSACACITSSADLPNTPILSTFSRLMHRTN